MDEDELEDFEIAANEAEDAEEVYEENEEGEGSERGNSDEADVEEVAEKGYGKSADVIPEQPQSRAQTRIQKLANDRRAAVDRAEKAERELAEARAVRENDARAQQAYAYRQQEQARLAREWETATPEERMAMMLQQTQAQVAQQMQAHQMQFADMQDRADFKAMTSGDKVATKYAAEVEKRIIELRNKGFNASRKDVYFHLLGEKLATQRGKASSEQRRTGKANINRQTVPARSARGDREGGRTSASEQDARRKRLENMFI